MTSTTLTSPRSTRRVRDRAPVALVLIGIVVAVFALIPLIHVVIYASTVDPDVIREQLFRPRIGMLLRNTLGLMVTCVAASIALSVACAWLVVRTNLPLAGLWHVLLTAPLAVPAFVNGFGWVSLTHSVEGFAGASMIVTLSYFPFVYLPVCAALHGLDPVHDEMAASVGLGRTATFFRVVLPQLRPAILGGSLLVALHMFSEFGALKTLRFPTFTTAIYDQFNSTFNGPAAHLSSALLVLLCLAVLTLELALRGRRRYARTSSGTPRAARRIDLGAWRWPATLAPLVVVALALGVPIYSLVHWMLVGSSTGDGLAELLPTAATTMAYAALGALLSVVLALPVGLLVVRHASLTSTLVERSTYTANALPGIVVALALITVTINYAVDLYQSAVVLMAAYLILFLSRAVVSVRASLEQAPPVLENVAKSLGLSGLATTWRVTVPIVLPGIGAGAALVFIAICTELTATLLLAPLETQTLATEFWSHSSGLSYGAAAPYALVMIAISMPAVFLLSRTSRAARPLAKEKP
ncbi:iron(III) transport system permease protein [Nocardioides daedukensis]|uniref:Iron(III) transport system permease protein n=1 Tax=Nocardioides daedukensis TaxID=634462 RepID=A0A7Y9S1V0_9ACTN|nr:iron ABC transporter permease [Nocardioides daedukensis]NYG59686.1 iron(III) transport system permease protein [Nocardioides daedukensis]